MDQDYITIALAINHCYSQRSNWNQRVGITSCMHRIADALCKEHPEFPKMLWLSYCLGLVEPPEGGATLALAGGEETIAQAEAMAEHEREEEASADSHGLCCPVPQQRSDSPIEMLDDLGPVVADAIPLDM